jgi:hypothetical protein
LAAVAKGNFSAGVQFHALSPLLLGLALILLVRDALALAAAPAFSFPRFSAKAMGILFLVYGAARLAASL